MKVEKLSNQTDDTINTKIKGAFSDTTDAEQSDFQSLLNPNAMNNFSLAMQNMDLISSDLRMDLDCLSISENDALFFNELTKNPQFSLSATTNELINLGELTNANDVQVYKSMSVSKTLFNLIDKAKETQKPVRLDFDNNVTVIMKVDREGKLTAEFIPGDKAVEMYLRNNIPFLKQRFEEQNIAYNDLYYRQDARNHSRRNDKGDKNE